MERNDISRLVDALVARGYDRTQRAALLAGIDPRVRGALRELGRPYDQALSDVQELLRFGEVGRAALGELIRSAAEGAVGPSEPTLRAAYQQVVGQALPVVAQAPMVVHLAPLVAQAPGPQVAQVPPGREVKVKTILFLGANPLPPPTTEQKRYRQLRIDQEAETIRRELRLAPQSAGWRVEHRFAASFAELQRALLEVKPDYLHVGCHGEAGRLVLVDDAGQLRFVPWDAVVEEVHDHPTVQGCVFMACDSALLAERVAQGAPFAVGMSEGMPDEAALAWSQGFYLALARGEAPERCHAIARRSVMALGKDDHDIPRFFAGRPTEVPAAGRPTAPAVTAAVGLANVAVPGAVAPAAVPPTPQAPSLRRSTLVLSPWPAVDLPALGLPPPQVVVAGPPNSAQGPWQKEHPPGSPAWAEAEAGITAALARCQSLTGRLAVLASTSYAMGAWLGLGLANLPLELEFWQAWGPPPQQWNAVGRAEDRGDAVLLPTGLATVQPGRPVALSVGITHRVVDAEVDASLAEAGVTDAQRVVLAPPQVGFDALKTPEQARQAAWDLATTLGLLHDRLQGQADIHLFCVGPLVVLMMAAGRLRTVNPVVVHERHFAAEKWQFSPAVRFAGGWARRVK